MAFDNFTYSDENVKNIIFPLGGIGAGCIGLGGDGRLQDWEIFNSPNKGTVNGNSHFAIRAEHDGQVVDTRVLHGSYHGELLGSLVGERFNRFGFGASRSKMTGFPSFEKATFTGPYPIATVDFYDKRFPADVQMTAFSPFIPLDSQNSSLPVAMFEFNISNTMAYDLDYTLFGCMGFDFKDDVEVHINSQSGTTSITGVSTCEKSSLDYSEITLSTDSQNTSYQRHAFRGSWFDTLEIYWQDISAGGALKDRFYDQDTKDMNNNAGGSTEHSILASHIHIKSGETKTVRMAISWYVPNISRCTLGQDILIQIKQPKCCPDTPWKNYYATQWHGAQHVAQDVFTNWQGLQDKTNKFQHVLSSSTLPESIIDAVSSTISVLKSPTTLRLEDGTFYGWEGCHDDGGCCEGSCTHVWNYQQALPFLFPDLERGLRTADYIHNQKADTGGMSFRMSLPMGIGSNDIRPCCDGQFGNVMHTYRDWKLNGDNAWLESMYPHVKACMEFTWHPDNEDKWDPDQTGVLTGRQHHTLDMEFFGPNSWLTGFYLGALKATAEMATAVGDTETCQKYMAIYEKGRAWVHENLFNGSYFYHKLDLSDKSLLAPYEGTSASPVVKFDVYDLYWNEEYNQLKYQIGEGCSIDQVLAQFHAGICGLGDIFEKDAFLSAVNAIYDNNYMQRLGDMANPCRVYGLGDESGTLICAYPEGAKRPVIPVPYTQETMHGFEYAFGCQLMMAGELKKGVQVFNAVRDRYKGHNRNPYNEIECGSHYARSMTSYGAILVLSGFDYDLPNGVIAFDPKVQQDGTFQSIWTTGTGWGYVTITDGQLKLHILQGDLPIDTLIIQGVQVSKQDFNTSYESTIIINDNNINIECLPHIDELK